MIHLYLSLPPGDLEDHEVVGQILDLNAGVGLVQAATGDDDTTRRIAAAHISACDGLVAVISGSPEDSQIREIRWAEDAGVPVWLLSSQSAADTVVDRPVRSFTPESFLEFVNQVRASRT